MATLARRTIVVVKLAVKKEGFFMGKGGLITVEINKGMNNGRDSLLLSSYQIRGKGSGVSDNVQLVRGEWP
jgi:hypothetical protein